MNPTPKTFRSNGKLMLTGEYVVLDGAMALAVPTTFGQGLTVENTATNTIIWESFDAQGNIWFEDCFVVDNGNIKKHFDNPDRYRNSVTIKNANEISNRLIQILEAAKSLNPEFLKTNSGYKITTHLEFNRRWGLGTSSTLINNIANWANINAYQLLALTFGGSGYDIACAQHNTAITYQLNNVKAPSVTPVDFNPSFKDQLYFVYLNQKQNSRDGIKAYKTLNNLDATVVSKINEITNALLKTQSLEVFKNLINTHESIISKVIQQKPIKQRLFNDFNGAIKSLGAWGGDFVLAASETNPTHYFKAKGFDTVVPYTDMILS